MRNIGIRRRRHNFTLGIELVGERGVGFIGKRRFGSGEFEYRRISGISESGFGGSFGERCIRSLDKRSVGNLGMRCFCVLRDRVIDDLGVA